MLKIIAFALSVTVLVSANAEMRPHIVGGTDAPEGAFPFMVSLRQSNGAFFCGGSLVSDRFVLTAAHCLHEPSEMRVGMGSVNLADQSIHEVEEVFAHPDYMQTDNSNDIALVKLKNPVHLNLRLQTIDFPYIYGTEGKNVTAMGWGLTSEFGQISPKLLYLNKNVISNDECNKKLNKYGVSVGKGHICLGSTVNFGICFGDSGSPLLYKENNKNFVVGVTSMAIPCARGYPDIYTRVSHYSHWIRKTIS